MAEIDPLRLPELYDAVCQLQASLQSDEVIDAALKAAIKLTGAERAFIKSPDAYSSVYAVPQLEYATKRLIETPLEALVRDVEQSRQSILIVDTRNDPRFAAEPLAALFASRAMLIVPLRAAKDFLGVIIADRAVSAGAFTSEDLATLEFFMGWAAIAIRHARLQAHQGRFISELSHELMQPLVSVKGFSEIILKEVVGPITDAQKQLLETVIRNADRMSRLIRDLLEDSRIETGRVKFDLTLVDLREVVERVVKALTPKIQGKQHAVALHLATIPPVSADRDRLTQVLTTLFDNAIKYTLADGKIDVRAEVQNQSVRLSICDTGIGIAADEQWRVFTRFYRGLNPVVREQVGIGFELCIAKSLIELMGGQIGFESEPGKGSTFWVTLPVTASPEQPSM